MYDYHLVIKNGKVVTPNGVKDYEIGIKDGLISALEQEVKGSTEQIWNAQGQYIFPGAIDVHVHFNEPGREVWEGFSTGSAMLAAGGVTTFFDMPLNGIPSTVTKEAFEEKKSIASSKSLVDFGLWGGLVPGNEEELSALSESGVVGFKAFMSPSGNEEFERADDDTLLKGMRRIAQLGKVLALHAESTPIVELLQKEKESQGLSDADAYASSRPIEAEVEAVQRAISFARITGCPLHFVHISSAAAAVEIQKAKQEGLDITLETCPHYLLFTHQDLAQKGALAKCAPPLRKKHERERLVEALVKGQIDMVSSDHSPCTPDLKDQDNMFTAWGGINGGQFTLLSMIELALIYDLPFHEVAQWTASAPARRFGLDKIKGELKVGLQADLAVVHTSDAFTAVKDNMYDKHKFSVYEGRTFPCSVAAVFSSGEIVYEKNKGLISTRPGGKWLKPVENDLSSAACIKKRG
ncbi:allantoinase [Thalassobacillus sp. C254]|uniref:allantoinase n=1 Tax=Thalassobacillus sp. C254 TaxID=1225341 RepID=UPI0006D20FA7|nr:allantoinase [Thalassobacillus sp. C254]